MPTFPLASPVGYGVSSLQWGGRDNISRSRNPWTKQVITQVFDGQFWEGVLTFMVQTDADGRALSAWLTALRRPGSNSGTFLLGDPAATEPLGSAQDTPGAPVINGASQAGEAINIDGLPVSVTGYLLAGDYVQFGSGTTARLKKVLDDVDTNASGEATINVWPAVRTGEAPSDNSTVVVSGAEGLFFSPTSLSEWQVRPPIIYDSITLSVMEKF